MVPIIILLEFPFHKIILGYSNKNPILPLVPILTIETLFAIPPIRRLLRLMGKTLQKPLEKNYFSPFSRIDVCFITKNDELRVVQ